MNLNLNDALLVIGLGLGALFLAAIAGLRYLLAPENQSEIQKSWYGEMTPKRK